MIDEKILAEINSLSDGNIDYFIQFWSERTNIENADVEPMQADILFYLNSLKHFKSKIEEMQKALEWYADPKNYRHVESAAYSDVALDEGETARDALKGVETN